MASFTPAFKGPVLGSRATISVVERQRPRGLTAIDLSNTFRWPAESAANSNQPFTESLRRTSLPHLVRVF